MNDFPSIPDLLKWTIGPLAVPRALVPSRAVIHSPVVADQLDASIFRAEKTSDSRRFQFHQGAAPIVEKCDAVDLHGFSI